MSPPVEAGHEILVPLFGTDAAERLYHVEWSQDASTRTADYYLVTADNLTIGTRYFPFPIPSADRDGSQENNSRSSFRPISTRAA